MNIMILGAGGIGSYYGVRLIDSGHQVTFIARGEHLKAIKKKGLKLTHPEFSFFKKVKALSLEELEKKDIMNIEAIILTTKSISTDNIAKQLSIILKTFDLNPYIISLQNGVENEEVLCKYFNEEKIIGELTRKIGAHIISPGIIETTGKVETILGTLKENTENKKFLFELNETIKQSNILSEISNNIKLELWKKLIINNGVNAICALLEVKTGTIMHNEKLSKIVFGLMQETANAAKFVNIEVRQEDVKKMFELIKNFDSIKPSMLVDKEFNRPLEIDEICGVVINNNDKQNVDSPYTRTISTILEFNYSKSR